MLNMATIQPPSDPIEPTSTIVLTSRKCYFVDIRIQKTPNDLGAEATLPIRILAKERLEWAFAGTSKSTKSASYNVDQSYHSVWTHWLDSRTSNPGPDEGFMYDQGNGDTLERGEMMNPVTKTTRTYEELWGDIQVEIMKEESKRVSVVLKAENLELDIKALVVRVGQWCQGIRRDGDSITAERWHWNSCSRTSTSVHENEKDDESNRRQLDRPGSWKITRIGNSPLPCDVATGIVTATLGEGNEIFCGDLLWKVVEYHRW